MDRLQLIQPTALPEVANDLEATAQWWDLISHALDGVKPAQFLMIGHVFFPLFLDIQGCAILPWRYDASNFAAWWDKFEGNHAAVESMLNHTHLCDLISAAVFHGEGDRVVLALAYLLAECWSAALGRQFPDRRYRVEVDADDPNGPTVYIVRHQEGTARPN